MLPTTDVYIERERFQCTFWAYQHRARAGLKQLFSFASLPLLFFAVTESFLLIRGTSVLKVSHMEPDTHCLLLVPPVIDSSLSLCLEYLPTTLPPSLPISGSRFQRTLTSSARSLHVHFNNRHLLNSHCFAGTEPVFLGTASFSQDNLVWKISTHANNFTIITSRQADMSGFCHMGASIHRAALFQLSLIGNPMLYFSM